MWKWSGVENCKSVGMHDGMDEEGGSCAHVPVPIPSLAIEDTRPCYSLPCVLVLGSGSNTVWLPRDSPIDTSTDADVRRRHS